FFEDRLNEFTPFDEDPLFTAGDRKVMLKDIAALAAMIQNPAYQQRKRVYLNEIEPFTALFKNLDFDEIKNAFVSLQSNGTYELKSSIPFVGPTGRGSVRPL
ncbi:MAG TPA: hypothetical protein VF149_06675, partial [Bacillales bacterium]